MSSAMPPSVSCDPAAPPLGIAQVIGNLNWGGTQELLVCLARRQKQEGVRLHVFVLDAPADTPYFDRLTAENAPVTYLPKGRGGRISQTLSLARALRESGMQLAHSHLRLANTLTPPAGVLAGLPVLGGLHLPVSGSTARAKIRGLAEGCSLRFGSCGAVACASAVASDNRRRLGTLPIAIVPNPAPDIPDLEIIEAHRIARREPNDPVRFITIGRLSPEKCVDVILKAAQKLAKRGSPFRLSIVGDGADRTALQELARQLGLRNQVAFLGAQTDVSSLYAKHDVYLTASRAEGLSIALLEAMAHGMPAVVTPAGGSDTLIDETTGRRVPLEEPEALSHAMEELATDAELRRKLGRAAHSRVAGCHRLEQWSRSLCGLYRQALAGVYQERARHCLNDT